MHTDLSPLDIVAGMARALRPPSGDMPPHAAMDELLHRMLEAFVAASRAARAVAILLEPGDAVPRLRAAVPDAGLWPASGEALREHLHPVPTKPVMAAGAARPPVDASAVVVRFGPGGGTGTGLAVAVFSVPHPEGGEVRGAFATEILTGGPGALAMAAAAELVAVAVSSGLFFVAERAAHAAEIVALRSRVLAGFTEAFGPGSCPGLAAMRPEVEQAAREQGPVLLHGEPGTGKVRLARLVHELSSRASRPFAVTRADDMEAVFGRDDNGTPWPGAVEDAAGGTLYLADAAGLTRVPEAAARLVRLVRHGWFTRCGSDMPRRANVRVILGSSLGPGELTRRCPELSALLHPPGTGDGVIRTIRLPPLRERPDDVPILLQRAVDRLAGRAGERLSFTPRAMKALRAYSWPDNDEEVSILTAEALLSRTGRRLDVGDLPSRIFSLAPGDESGPDGAGRDAVAADTLWEMERDRVLAALERHGWVRARAAQELGLTPRQLGWRIKRHGLRPQEGE